MDKIIIQDLQVETIIGAYAYERQQPQSLFITAELSVDITQAAHSDDINVAVDYAAVADTLKQFAAISEYQLVETFAEKIAQLILQKFAIQHLRLTVSKPSAIPAAKNTSIIIERSALLS